MKDQETGSMEQDIVNEEVVSAPDPKKGIKPQLPKIQISKDQLSKITTASILTFSKTKLLAAIAVLVVIVIVLISIIVLSSKQKETIVLDPEIEIVSPEPKSNSNPEFAKIEQEIQLFKNKVDLITNLNTELPPPTVELNISF